MDKENSIGSVEGEDEDELKMREYRKWWANQKGGRNKRESASLQMRKGTN